MRTVPRLTLGEQMAYGRWIILGPSADTSRSGKPSRSDDHQSIRTGDHVTDITTSGEFLQQLLNIPPLIIGGKGAETLQVDETGVAQGPDDTKQPLAQCITPEGRPVGDEARCPRRQAQGIEELVPEVDTQSPGGNVMHDR